MIGKIINDKFLTFEGLYYDAWLLHPQDFRNVDDLNHEVDRINASIKDDPDNHQWRPLIGLHREYWEEEVSAGYKNILSAKVSILLYDDFYKIGDEWPTLTVFQKVDFVCVPINKTPQSQWPVYTNYVLNNVAEYFDGVTQAVALAGGTPDPEPIPEPTPIPVIDGDLEIIIPQIKIIIRKIES